MEVKSKSYFFEIWAGIGLIAFVLIWYLPWRFQVNDDEVMMWLVSGTYTGKPEAFAVFIHPILSWIFSKAYAFEPDIPWYPALWFLIMLFSFLALIRLIASRPTPLIQRQVWAFFLFGFFVHFLFFLQFSIVAAFSISAGLGSRLIVWNQNKKPWYHLRFSDFFILFGYLIRPEVLFLFLIGGAVLNFLVIKDKQLYFGLLLPLFLSILGSITLQLWIERTGLREFYEINRLRSQVFDHPSLQLHKEEFKTSDPDLYHFGNGLIDFNRDLTLPEKLPIWKNELDQKRFLNLNVDSLTNSLSTFLLHEHFFVGLFAFFLTFSFLLKWKKSILMFLILFSGLILLSPFFLLKVQIYAIVFLLYFTLCLVYLDSGIGLKNVWIVYLLILTGSIFFHFISYFQSSKNILSARILNKEIGKIQSEGIQEIYLVGSGNLYQEIMFDRPLRFRVLGWPTLLEMDQEFEGSGRKAYLIDSTTYYNNEEYFKTEERKEGSSNLILLTTEK
ncbi:MAG: hypothetical protein PSV36_10320 [Algoriphagus sp.]|nr:hypothetical protein [Algoriphagus sp.]